MCCRNYIITPSTLGLMMAFVCPCSLYHTYPFWLVVNLTIYIITIIIIVIFYLLHFKRCCCCGCWLRCNEDDGGSDDG